MNPCLQVLSPCWHDFFIFIGELLHLCKCQVTFSSRLNVLLISALQFDINSGNTEGLCRDGAFRLRAVTVLTHSSPTVWWLISERNNSVGLVICWVTFVKCLWGKREWWAAQLCDFQLCQKILDNSRFRQPPILAGDMETAPILAVPSLTSPGISHQNARHVGTSWEGNGSQRYICLSFPDFQTKSAVSVNTCGVSRPVDVAQELRCRNWSLHLCSSACAGASHHCRGHLARVRWTWNHQIWCRRHL